MRRTTIKFEVVIVALPKWEKISSHSKGMGRCLNFPIECDGMYTERAMLGTVYSAVDCVNSYDDHDPFRVCGLRSRHEHHDNCITVKGRKEYLATYLRNPLWILTQESYCL